MAWKQKAQLGFLTRSTWNWCYKAQPILIIDSALWERKNFDIKHRKPPPKKNTAMEQWGESEWEDRVVTATGIAVPLTSTLGSTVADIALTRALLLSVPPMDTLDTTAHWPTTINYSSNTSRSPHHTALWLHNTLYVFKVMTRHYVTIRSGQLLWCFIREWGGTEWWRWREANCQFSE